jgi:hypothetical protein
MPLTLQQLQLQCLLFKLQCLLFELPCLPLHKLLLLSQQLIQAVDIAPADGNQLVPNAWASLLQGTWFSWCQMVVCRPGSSAFSRCFWCYAQQPLVGLIL